MSEFLTSQTKIGLTFGQIISIIIIVFGFGIQYAKLNADIAENRVKIIELESRQDKSDLVDTKTYDMLLRVIQSQASIEGKLGIEDNNSKIDNYNGK